MERISSDARHGVGTLSGTESADVEWIVRAPAGGEATITAAHPKGGKASRTIELDAAATS